MWSDDRRYRYVWKDCWAAACPSLLVACLIPSRANEEDTDDTVAFCRKIAQCPHPEVGDDCAEGFGAIVIVNMYARYDMAQHKKATNAAIHDLLGDSNEAWIVRQACEIRANNGRIVLAWGDDGWTRHGRMLELLTAESDELWCLGTSEKNDTGVTGKGGFPRHPQALLRRGTKAGDVGHR